MNETLPLTAFGVISSLLTLGMIYYTFQIVKAFRRNTELAATKMVLHEEILGGFKTLCITSLAFAFMAYVGSMALAIDYRTIMYLSEIGGMVMMSGFIYFQRAIANAVKSVER